MTVRDDVLAYLASVGVPAGRYSNAVLDAAILTEDAAQESKCDTTGSPAPLAEALCRRVQVNLAKRALPLGVADSAGDAEGRVFLPSQDPEIRRLEAPYRKVKVG